jgi:hypothetical protein
MLRYKERYSQLGQALKEGTKLLIEDLELSLFRIAKGGIKTKTTKKIYNRNRVTGELELDKVEEQENTSLPNVSALVFSLKNLAPESWQDKREYINNADYDNNKESLLVKMKEALNDREEEVVPDDSV